jgi:hypothetical protein
LPLLAFTLAHLYDNYRAGNELTLSGYNRIGRIEGVIEKAFVRAFEEGVARDEIPKDEKAQLALARSGFIPHLAQVNYAAGGFEPRLAARDQIPAEARPLIDCLADQRLLIKDRRKGAEGKEVDVVEVAHEALLRQPPLSDWLVEDSEFLVWSWRLSQARKACDAKQRGLLAGLELDIARDWLQRKRQIEPSDEAFIRDSIKADDKRRAEEAERARAVEQQLKSLVAGSDGSERRCYVSYAWADESNPKRDELVIRMCDDASKLGLHIFRDKTTLSHGSLISEFMYRIGEGYLVFIFLSDKYLRSQYCMFELSEMWRNKPPE